MTQLIVAIDTSDGGVAEELIKQLKPHCHCFKFGHRYLVGSPYHRPSVKYLPSGSMIDLKLHDIPDQVAKTVHLLTAYEPSIITVHASGGTDMITAACTVIDNHKSNTLVAAITVLTSLQPDDKGMLSEIGVYTTPRLQTLRLCHMASKAGAQAVMCSAESVEEIRSRFPDLITIVPGVRTANHSRDDQHRTGTPQRIALDGAHYAVVGRPITLAADPQQACRDFADMLK